MNLAFALAGLIFCLCMGNAFLVSALFAPTFMLRVFFAFMSSGCFILSPYFFTLTKKSGGEVKK
jgi:hypothetical protein